MGKYEEKKMMKKRQFVKNTWHYWLIHHTSEPIKMVGAKEKIMSLFKTNTTKDHYKPARVNAYINNQEKT